MSLPTKTSVTRPQAWGYDAALDDLLIRFAQTPPVRIVTAPKQPDRIQTEQTSEDYLPEFGRVFSRNNFTGGAGLDFAHRADADRSDATRYWDSKGIDISVVKPGELATASLLVDTESLWASANSNLYMTELDDDTLIYADGSGLFSVASPGDGSPSRTSEDPHTGTETVEGLAALGDEAYAACGTDGIGFRNSGGTWSDMASATNCFGLWAVKSRLIADSGGGLIQTISLTDGAPTTLLTMDSGDTVTSVVDAGAAILIATSNGTIYSLSDESGTLTLQSQTNLTSTDIVKCMAWVEPVLIVGTADGTVGRIWRTAVADSQRGYTIRNAQLLRELPYIPTAAVATRDRIYVAARDSATETVLWRYQLATASISRDLVFAATTAGDPVAVTRVAEKLYCTVAANDVFREDTALVSDGWLISPMADFFSPEKKTWVGIKIQAENLSSDTDIEVLLATDPDALLDKDDFGLWSQIGRITDQTQTAEDLLVPAIEGRYGGLQLRLNSDGSTSPRLVSFALRSFSDSEDVIVQLPVNVSDVISIPNRRPVRVRNRGQEVFDALLGYDGEYVTLELFRLDLIVKGVVETIDTPATRPESGSYTTASVVQIRGRFVAAGASSQSANGTYGVKTLGIWKLGA